MEAQDSSDLLVYVGTYTQSLPHVRGKAEGIYLCRFDPASGILALVGLAAPAVNPSYLALEPEARFLYAVGEVGGPDGHPHGIVVAFARDAATGALTRLNERSTHGDGPCFVSVDRAGRVVMAANYRSGSIAAYPIGDDGALGEVAATFQHAGSSVNQARQAGPHAHSITPTPDNRYAIVADLGLDRLMIYQIEPERGALLAHDPPAAEANPGAGPRHLDFHTNGRHVYVINELDSTVTAYEYGRDAGTLAPFQTISTLPDGYSGRNTTADIHVHPSGRFLYGSNRSHDSIVAYAIDGRTGRLTLVGHESTRGEKPRNFAIDPNGMYLLAANQDSDTIVTFSIDQEGGALSPTGHITTVPTPVCIRFVPPITPSADRVPASTPAVSA